MSSTNHPSFWPYDARDRVVLGWKGLVVGVLVADVVFFLVPRVISASQNPQYAEYQLSFLPILIVVGALPIGLVGVPTAMQLGKVLRGIRNQWIHVAAFIAAGALVGTLVGVTFTGWTTHTLAYMSLPAALGSGIGRLAVWKLVHINDHPSLT
ncbi:hypothetical protein [Arthrobacter sp. ISL-95]|uniref:hypothetical protein n=1 Tax=Arthrobacter sp. ISL-95 TaxID=2819116 RepID=UPI001BE8EE80|nr:hypothetical protein [Arthrobacter sp. ISL-95]MBT2584815.1 hypothetical protein [Arthrobacter sp. ISL-95]